MYVFMYILSIEVATASASASSVTITASIRDVIMENTSSNMLKHVYDLFS